MIQQTNISRSPGVARVITHGSRQWSSVRFSLLMLDIVESKLRATKSRLTTKFLFNERRRRRSVRDSRIEAHSIYYNSHTRNFLCMNLMIQRSLDAHPHGDECMVSQIKDFLPQKLQKNNNIQSWKQPSIEASPIHWNFQSRTANFPFLGFHQTSQSPNPRCLFLSQ